MQAVCLLLLALLGSFCGGQHVLPIDLVHNENPYHLMIPSAAVKDPHFIRGVMQLQESLPAGYSIDPNILTVASASTSREDLGRDPLVARLEAQTASAKDREPRRGSKAGRNRRDVSGEESRDRGDYRDDRKDSSAGSGEDDGPGDGFGFDRNAKAKLEEEMASAERAVAKYDKMFGANGKFNTVDGDDGSFGGSRRSSRGEDGPYNARGSDGGFGYSDRDGYGGRGRNNYAVTGGDSGYRGSDDYGGSRRNRDGYDKDDRYSPAGENDYRPHSSGGGGGGGEQGNDGGYRPPRDYQGSSGAPRDRNYEADSGDSYNGGSKRDDSRERDNGYSRANDGGYGKGRDYGSDDKNTRGYGGNDQYAEGGGSYKPVNREGSYSRSINFHEKPKPKLKPYREILEEEDRKGGGAPFESNDDGFDGKTEGFDGNYKAEGFNRDDRPSQAGGRDDYGGASQEAASDKYVDKRGNPDEDRPRETGGRGRDNETKYARLDGPDYESQRGTDYYDRNNAGGGGGRGPGPVQASERQSTIHGSPRLLKTIDQPVVAPQRRANRKYSRKSKKNRDLDAPPSRPRRRHKRSAVGPSRRDPEPSADLVTASFAHGDGNEGELREIPSSFDGIVTGSGFIEDIAPHGEVNSTSSTRVVNYSTEEGYMPSRRAVMEDEYLSRTGRELGPAPPGMDPTDERFRIGAFKPVFPVEDPTELRASTDDGQSSPAQSPIGQRFDPVRPSEDFVKMAEERGGFGAEMMNTASGAFNHNPTPTYNGPYRHAPMPTPAPYVEPKQDLHYPPEAFQGRAEFEETAASPMPLPSPEALQDNPTMAPSPMMQQTPGQTYTEEIGPTAEMEGAKNSANAREQGTRYKHEHTQIIQKQNIHRSTYGNNPNNNKMNNDHQNNNNNNNNNNNLMNNNIDSFASLSNKNNMPNNNYHRIHITHPGPATGSPVYRSQIQINPNQSMGHPFSSQNRPVRRSRRSASSSKILSLEVTRVTPPPVETLPERPNLAGNFGQRIGPTVRPLTVLKRSRRSPPQEGIGNLYGKFNPAEKMAGEGRLQAAILEPSPSKDMEVAASMKSSKANMRSRPGRFNSSVPTLTTADTSNEEILWGLQLAKKEPNGKKQSKVVIINTGEDALKPQWFIASPTPKPARGILGWLGFSRTPAKTFEEQLAADILGRLEDKDQVILHAGDPDDDSKENNEEIMREKPRKKRPRRNRYRKNRHRRPSGGYREEDEGYHSTFEGSDEGALWDDQMERPRRRKPLKLLVLPSSQEEPDEQANERLEIVQKFPRGGGRRVYREFRPSRGGGGNRVREKILLYSSSFGEPVVALPEEKHDQKRDVSQDKTFMKRSDGPKIRIISLQKENSRAFRSTGQTRLNFSVPGDIQKGFVILGKPLDGGGHLNTGTPHVHRTAGPDPTTIRLLKKPQSAIAEITVSSTIKVKGE